MRAKLATFRVLAFPTLLDSSSRVRPRAKERERETESEAWQKRKKKREREELRWRKKRHRARDARRRRRSAAEQSARWCASIPHPPSLSLSLLLVALGRFSSSLLRELSRRQQPCIDRGMKSAMLSPWPVESGESWMHFPFVTTVLPSLGFFALPHLSLFYPRAVTPFSPLAVLSEMHTCASDTRQSLNDVLAISRWSSFFLNRAPFFAKQFYVFVILGFNVARGKKNLLSQRCRMQ